MASVDYFRTMRIPIVRGRVFGAGDDMTAPMVGVINGALARAYFPNTDPIGHELVVGADTLRIVGVVGDVTIGNIEDKIPPTLYLSFAKTPQEAMAVVVRTSLDPEQMARAMRASVSSIDAAAALSAVTTMSSLVTESPSIFMRRFPLYVVGAFAMTALLLAVVGIYGVVSYSVAQRTREMGIRMALGASPASLVRLVVRHGGSMATAGIGSGVVAALLLGRFAEKLLYGVRASDPLTYLCVAGVLAAVAVGATILPARRATRVDPALALRSD
jgi:putative ABC transport system permease protein